MAYNLAAGGEFDPKAWSSYLQSTVVPAVRTGAIEYGIKDVWTAGPGPEEERDALLQASRDLAPPEDMDGAAEVYSALMTMLALRANMPDLITTFRRVDSRYVAAAGWICENFGELIWWNCDRDSTGGTDMRGGGRRDPRELGGRELAER